MSHLDYPRKKIGKGNPYSCCAHCGVSDPAINGKLENHAEHCEYRKKHEASSKIFNEDSLRAAIVTVWGEHGVHAEIFDMMRQHIKNLEAAQKLNEKAFDTMEIKATHYKMQLDLIKEKLISWATVDTTVPSHIILETLKDLK